jgi:hypothetical protein
MAKATLREDRNSDTPSQAIVNSASTTQIVTDSKGRQIGIRRMKALDRLRMFEVLGAENAKNEPYLGYAALAFHVCSIDEEKINRPTSKLQLEGLIQHLGDEGMEAVGEELQKMLEKQPSPSEQIEQIKN